MALGLGVDAQFIIVSGGKHTALSAANLGFLTSLTAVSLAAA
jgi:hypothetical protein